MDRKERDREERLLEQFDELAEQVYTRRGILGRAALGGAAIGFAGSIPALARGAAAATVNSSASGGTILNSFFTLNNIYYFSYDKGTQLADKAFGFKHQDAVSNSDNSKQRADLENAKSRGITGVTMISNSEAIEPELMRILNREKIYVCNMWNNAPWSTPVDIGPYYLTYGVVNAPATFEALATQLFKKLGGKGKVIQIDGIRGVSVNTERLAGVDAALKKFPGINVVATQPGGWSRNETRGVIEDLLVAHSDVNGIITHNDDEAVAVIAALRSKDLLGKVFVSGNDGVPVGLDMVKKGELYCTLPTHAPWLGGQFVARIYDAIHGWKPTPAERMIHWGAFVINTPAAAAEYERIMYKGNPPYNWRKMSRVLNPQDWDPQNLIVPFDPAKYWAYRAKEKPKGYQLPTAYRGATWKADYAKTKALYAAHYKSDPTQKARKLCNNGAGAVIV